MQNIVLIPAIGLLLLGWTALSTFGYVRLRRRAAKQRETGGASPIVLVLTPESTDNGGRRLQLLAQKLGEEEKRNAVPAEPAAQPSDWNKALSSLPVVVPRYGAVGPEDGGKLTRRARRMPDERLDWQYFNKDSGDLEYPEAPKRIRPASVPAARTEPRPERRA